MRQYKIEENDAGMRLDRYLKKVFPQAGLSLIYKSVRKKNIVVNKSKVSPEYILELEDVVSVFFSDETIEKFQGQGKEKRRGVHPKIVFDSQHILIMEKPVGVLSHGRGGDFEDNMVDRLIAYLIDTNQYLPRKEKTFSPSICNRLDRNTSGLIIGAKTAIGLRQMNQMIRDRLVDKYYLTICQGHLKEKREIHSSMDKDPEKNRVFASSLGKEAFGIYEPLDYKKGYSLVSVQLITGRTHQIRHQLASIGLPVVGDQKYGFGKTNYRGDLGKNVFHQLLHSHKLVFHKIEGDLSDLSEKVIESKPKGLFAEVWEEIANG